MIRVRVRVKVRVKVRVRVTKLVYQIGFTTPFYVSRARKYFSSKQQQQAAASSKQQAHVCLSAYLRHHRRDIAQTFMVHSPNDALQTHKVSGRNSPRGRVIG